ncbi:MAG: hypothetical protein KDK27_08900, partial [Leptospiraceae bacterium]|nr:hypothetical protein [Leptospiraceae bacterium]
DLYPFLPAVKPPESYEPDQNLAFGLFYNLNAPDLRLIYNNARLDGDIAITPEEGVRANIDVANLNIAQFAPEYIQGLVNGNIRFTSPETFKQLSVAGNVNLRNGRYTIDRSRSGYQSLNLNTRATLFLDRKDVELEINDLTLNGRNAEGAPMLHLNAGGKLAFGDEQVYDTDIHRLQIDYQNLRPSLPGSIRYMLGPYQTYLSRGLGLNGDLTMRVSDSFSILSDNTLSIPFLKVDDLRIVNRLHFEENRIRFEKVDLQAFRGSLTAALQGVLQKRADEWTPTLNVSMHIERPELYQVHDNLRLQGLASLEADVNGDRARGRVFIQDLDVEYFEGVCSTANPDCYSVYVQDLNLDLPFLHDVAWRDPLQLSQNPGKTYMQDYGQGQQSNFVIGSVHSSHNPRGEFAPGRFYYIGAPANQNVSGLAARLDYKKNVLIADHLRVRMYQPPDGSGPNANGWQAEGAIDSRELYLNLADLNTENMEAGINLAIKNLNLEPFLPRSKSNYDGIISADARLESTNLKEPLYNTTALVSIHRISPEFSGFVTRILMPAQIVALIVRNTLEIPAMRAELKGGLVYSYIKIQRARMFPGILISPGSDEIKQERMPLAQFLDRARSEVRDFAERGPGSDVNETTP